MKKKEHTVFGARLKTLREARGFTQQALADAAGMNKFGLAKLEQGVTEPYWPTVVRLAAALGVECTAFAAAPGPASEELPPEEPAPAAEPAKKPAAKKKPKGGTK